MSGPTNFVKLPGDGEQQNKGAKMDPVLWKVVHMSDDPSKFKVVDNSTPPINVAHLFNSEPTAQQFIDHHLWIKNNPCPEGQVHDPETGVCIVSTLRNDGFYGNQFIRNMSGNRTAGCIEIQTKGQVESNSTLGPANAVIHFEAGIPADIVGMKGSGDNNSDEITFIFKENHADLERMGKKPLEGRHNVKVTLEYKGKSNSSNAKYTGKVELGVEDDHGADSSPKELEGVTYENTDVIKKYEAKLGNPIKARGSYQDTTDGGVRYKLEVQDPQTKEWKKIFDHVDHGDGNHDIRKYRGASAYCSAIRIDGHAEGFTQGGLEHVKGILRSLHFMPLTTQKTSEQERRLPKIGYGSIKVEEIGPDDSN
jgi:hypothetical protein